MKVYGWMFLITCVASTIYHFFNSLSLETVDYIFSWENINQIFTTAYWFFIVFQIFSTQMDRLTLVDSVRSKDVWGINLGGKIESGVGLDEDELELRHSINCRFQLCFLSMLVFFIIQWLVQ